MRNWFKIMLISIRVRLPLNKQSSFQNLHKILQLQWKCQKKTTQNPKSSRNRNQKSWLHPVMIKIRFKIMLISIKVRLSVASSRKHQVWSLHKILQLQWKWLINATKKPRSGRNRNQMSKMYPVMTMLNWFIIQLTSIRFWLLLVLSI